MLRKRSQEEIDSDKAAMSGMLKVYKRLFSLPGLLLLLFAFFVMGYGKGYFDGYLSRPTIFQTETKHVRSH